MQSLKVKYGWTGQNEEPCYEKWVEATDKEVEMEEVYLYIAESNQMQPIIRCACYKE